MEKKFKLKVNDTFDFRFTKKELSALDINSTSQDKFHVLQEKRGFKAEITEADFLKRQYTIKINGSSYNVIVERELEMLIEEMGLSLGTAQLVNDIKAPMPGLILEVNVQEGREVKEGDYLLVLEAMKMENTLTAPRDGVVKSVTVQKGQSVEKNQLLIEMK